MGFSGIYVCSQPYLLGLIRQISVLVTNHGTQQSLILSVTLSKKTYPGQISMFRGDLKRDRNKGEGGVSKILDRETYVILIRSTETDGPRFQAMNSCIK